MTLASKLTEIVENTTELSTAVGVKVKALTEAQAATNAVVAGKATPAHVSTAAGNAVSTAVASAATDASAKASAAQTAAIDGAASAALTKAKVVRPHIDDFMPAYDTTSTSATVAAHTQALADALTAANGEMVRFDQRKRYYANININGNQHVNLGPCRLVQQKFQPLIQIARTWGPQVFVNAPTIQLWGGIGVQGAQFLSTITLPSGGYSQFKGGDAYNISSNDLYTWNAASGGTDEFYAVKAGFLTVLGIGLDVASPTAGALSPGQQVVGGTSGATGNVQSVIAQDATNSRIVLDSVSGDFTPGENLNLAAGSRMLAADGTTALTAGTKLGTAGAMCLIKAGESFIDTYTTSVVLRKVDQSVITNLSRVTIEIDDSTNVFIPTAQRKDAVYIQGAYAFDVGLIIRGGYCRGLLLDSCYYGTYDVRVTGGLPNHTDPDQTAVGYGVSLSGCTEGTDGKINVRQSRHGFTTNVNYTAAWSADGTVTFANGVVSDVHKKWGSVKFNRVTGIGKDCTNAVFDCHPGAYFTTFHDATAYASSATGRTGSLYPILATSRGIGTQFINVHLYGGNFNNDGVQANTGFKHVIRYKGCSTTLSPQYGYSQLYDSVRVDSADSTKGYWAKTVIEDCSFNLDRTGLAGQVGSPYVQRGLLLGVGDYEIRNVTISGFNDAPIRIDATSSGGVYQMQNVTCDYAAGSSTTPFQINGTVDLFLDNYGIRQSTTSKPTSVFEAVGPKSGSYGSSTNIQLLSDVRELSKLNLPSLLANTSTVGTDSVTRTGGAAITHRTARRLTLKATNTNQSPVPRVDPTTILWTVPLTADALCSLPLRSTGTTWPAINSDEFEITRALTATGAFSVLVRSGSTTIAKLGPGGTARVKYDHATDLWYVIDQGVIPALADAVVGVTNPYSTQTTDAALALSRSAALQTLHWTAAITADRALTLPTINQALGDRIRVVRAATATGAFNVNVTSGTVLKALAAGTWMEAAWTGTAWVSIGAGSL